MTHATRFAEALGTCLRRRDVVQGIERLAEELVELRTRRGRLFVLGVGGGAANAAHAVNDFRKLCAIEAYAPTDGIAELTARTNDEGWSTVFVEWLETSRLSARDTLLIFSVGGGTETVSACVHEAVVRAAKRGAHVLGVVGREDGTTAKMGDVVVVVGRYAHDDLLTPVTETVQIAVLHALVSDPRLQVAKTKW